MARHYKVNSAETTTPAPSRRHLPVPRVSLTVLGTLLVVLGELVLLTSVYHRGAPVHRQRITIAQYAGELQNATPGQSAAAAASSTGALVRELHSEGTSTRSLAPLQAAASAVTAAPADPAPLARLRISVSDLTAKLSSEQRSIDNQATAIYAALLVLASLGWMVWFRRLVSRHRALQQRLTEEQSKTESENRLAALVRNTSDVIVVCELDSTITYTTPSAMSVLGRESEQLLGVKYTDLMHPDDLPLFVHLLAGQRPGDGQSFLLRMHHGDGRTLNVEGTLNNLLSDPSVNGIVLTARDVTARVQLEDRLTKQAFTDSLTGLANRQLFSDRLDHALERRPDGTAQCPHIVLFCDLDDFKNVNDSLGHSVGDQVLAVVGDRVRAVFRSGDTAARLGGDEFAVLMEGTDLATSQQLAETLLTALTEPVIIDGRQLIVHASIGLAVAVPGEMTSEEVLRNADVAMYLAKDRGKSAIAVYESQLHEKALERLQLRADLQRALRRDELVLHYQPTIDLKSGAVAGFEALVRWQHPSRGFLPPIVFIPIAEESGQIVKLGSWVLRTACAAGAGMQTADYQPTISVNVASQQLSQTDFVDEVKAVLVETGLPSDRLCLEITESVVIRDLEEITQRLNALRALGIRIAIDDFGTGYSSLAYLSTLPVDILKVDKSFVDRVTFDDQGANLTEAIIAMSRTMRLTTVAEGVEELEQATWLADAECSYGQGFLWSKPVSLEQAHQILSNAAWEVGDVPRSAATPSLTSSIVSSVLDSVEVAEQSGDTGPGLATAVA